MKQGKHSSKYLNDSIYYHINDVEKLGKIVVDIIFQHPKKVSNEQKKILLKHLKKNCRYRAIMLFSTYNNYSILYYALLTGNYDLITFLIDEAKTYQKIKILHQELKVNQFVVLDKNTDFTALVHAENIQKDPALKLLLLLSQSPNKAEAALYTNILDYVTQAIASSAPYEIIHETVNEVSPYISWAIPSWIAKTTGYEYTKTAIIKDKSYEEVFASLFEPPNKYEALAKNLYIQANSQEQPDSPYIPKNTYTVADIIKSLNGQTEHPCYQTLYKTGIIHAFPPNIISSYDRANDLKPPQTFVSRLVKGQLYKNEEFSYYNNSSSPAQSL